MIGKKMQLSRGNTFSQLDNSLEQVKKDVIKILDSLRTLGVHVNPSCRFSLFARELDKVNNLRLGHISPMDIKWFLLSEGIRDYAELRIITSSKKIMSENISILKRILSGAEMPSQDANSNARDTQFELYIASILELSGFSVEFEEPDIIFSNKSRTYSLAAKRIKSNNQIRKRLREATKQIKDKPFHGFISISVDGILRNKDENIITRSPDALYEASDKLLDDFIKKNSSVISSTFDNQVLGHIYSLVVPAILPDYFSVGFSSRLLAISTVSPEDVNLYNESMIICKTIGTCRI